MRAGALVAVLVVAVSSVATTGARAQEPLPPPPAPAPAPDPEPDVVETPERGGVSEELVPETPGDIAPSPFEEEEYEGEPEAEEGEEDEADEVDAPVADDANPELHWPMVMLTGSVGLPGVGPRIEVFPLKDISLELGGTIPFLIPGTISLGARWRPSFVCAGCGGPLSARLGIGVEGRTFYNEDLEVFTPPEWMLVPTVDAMVMVRPMWRLGMFWGARGGLGATGSFAGGGPIVEPTFVFLLEAGVVVF
jgi:hypothetical protein